MFRSLDGTLANINDTSNNDNSSNVDSNDIDN